MKFLVDFFPVLAFFIAFYIPEDREQAMYVATAAAIAASFIQISALWLLKRKVEKLHLATFVLILVLGGLTLYLQDKTFIKWKPTAVNWLFALVFLGSRYIGAKPLVQRMMEHAITLPAAIWINLNTIWILFFLSIGCANLYVAYSFSDEVWVNFKLFGVIGLTLLFAVGQAFYLAGFAKDDGK